MRKFMQNEDGQGMVEYALIIALVSIVAIVALILIGKAIKARFSKVGNVLTSDFN